MAEEIKEQIYKFLQENSGEKMSQKEIGQRIKTSYPTVLKWISVLIAEDRINVEDYGNIKLVSYKEK